MAITPRTHIKTTTRYSLNSFVRQQLQQQAMKSVAQSSSSSSSSSSLDDFVRQGSVVVVASDAAGDSFAPSSSSSASSVSSSPSSSSSTALQEECHEQEREEDEEEEENGFGIPTEVVICRVDVAPISPRRRPRHNSDDNCGLVRTPMSSTCPVTPSRSNSSRYNHGALVTPPASRTISSYHHHNNNSNQQSCHTIQRVCSLPLSPIKRTPTMSPRRKSQRCTAGRRLGSGAGENDDDHNAMTMMMTPTPIGTQGRRRVLSVSSPSTSSTIGSRRSPPSRSGSESPSVQSLRAVVVAAVSSTSAPPLLPTTPLPTTMRSPPRRDSPSAKSLLVCQSLL
jgi:hypothetical protein